MSKEPKYAYRHVNVSVREDYVLKRRSIGKPVGELKNSDFKRSFIKMFWNNLHLKGLSDRDGKDLPKEETDKFFAAMYK